MSSAIEGARRSVTLRMNGVGNAFLRELGCSCSQCNAQKPRANTSASLIIRNESKNDGRLIENHIVFDCGLGVVDSLIDAGLTAVNHIFLSHNHNDHVLELDRLVQSHFRSNGSGEPIPCYCTDSTWSEGPVKHFGYLAQLEPKKLVHKLMTGGQRIDLDLGVGLSVTAVAVYHGHRKVVPEPLIWVLEFGTVKVILGWDLLHLDPGYPDEDWDNSELEKRQASNDLLPEHQLLVGADELFFEANTYDPNPSTGHTSVRAVVEFYARYLQPKGRTWVVHYSGHEDRGGPLSDSELQTKINNTGAGNIHVAAHGMTLSWAGPE